MSNAEPRYALPWYTWRALHSAFMDFALRIPEPMQDALIIRVGGDFSFERFMLAIHSAGALNVWTHMDGEDIRIGISIPVSDGPDWVLTSLDNRSHGVTAEWLIESGRLRIDEELDQLLNS